MAQKKKLRDSDWKRDRLLRTAAGKYVWERVEIQTSVESYPSGFRGVWSHFWSWLLRKPSMHTVPQTATLSFLVRGKVKFTDVQIVQNENPGPYGNFQARISQF